MKMGKKKKKTHVSWVSATVSMNRLRGKYNVVDVLDKLYGFKLALAYFHFKCKSGSRLHLQLSLF